MMAVSLSPSRWDLAATCPNPACRSELPPPSATPTALAVCLRCRRTSQRCGDANCRAWNAWLANRCRGCGGATLDPEGSALSSLPAILDDARARGCRAVLESVAKADWAFPGWPDTPDVERTILVGSRGRLILIGPTGEAAIYDPDDDSGLRRLGPLGQDEVRPKSAVARPPVGAAVDGRYLIVATAVAVDVCDLDRSGLSQAKRAYSVTPGEVVAAGPYIWSRSVLVLVRRADGTYVWRTVPPAPDRRPEAAFTDPTEFPCPSPVVASVQAHPRGVLFAAAEGILALEARDGRPRVVVSAEALRRDGITLTGQVPVNLRVVQESLVITGGHVGADGSLRTVALVVARPLSASPAVTVPRVSIDGGAPWEVDLRGGRADFAVVGVARTCVFDQRGSLLYAVEGEGGGGQHPLLVDRWTVFGSTGGARLVVAAPDGRVTSSIAVGRCGIKLIWRPPFLCFLSEGPEGPVLSRIRWASQTGEGST